MNRPQRTLAVDLSFRPNPDPTVWHAALLTLLAVQPEPRLDRLERHLAEPATPERWSDDLLPDLAALCASTGPALWRIFRYFDPRSLTADASAVGTKLTLTLDCPEDPLTLFVQVIEAVSAVLRPALATGFNPASPSDSELLLQGAGELRQVPPLLYLDEPALAPVPRALLTEAACEVRELNSGGMLIRTRAEPLDPPTEAEEAAAERVGDALGL